MRNKILALCGVAVLSLFGAMMLISPAQAQDCRTVVSTLVDRPDSAVGGGTWALDQIERTVDVCQLSEGVYQATVTDVGTFETLELDHTPNGVSQELPAGIPGNITGGFTTVEFDAAPGWDSFDSSVLDGVTVTGTDHPSGTWVSDLFTDVDAATLAGDTWSWTYTSCAGEEWVNQAAALGGNQGDITGEQCPDPEPTPTETVSASPTTKPVTCDEFSTQDEAQVAYEAGATQLDGNGDGVACESLPAADEDQLPTTGSPLTWIVVIGVALLLGGGTLFALSRLRRQTQ